MKLWKWGIVATVAFWGGLFVIATMVAVAGVSGAAAERGAGTVVQLPAGVTLMWPIEGPVTAGFGMRDNPTEPGSEEMHWGTDIAAVAGTPIRAATSGRVTLAGVAGGYGNLVVLASPGGALVTWYGHLSRFAVTAGDQVEIGHVIGYVGSTGRSTGPHLHFEIRPRGGNPIDPLTLLPPIDQSTTADK